MMKLWPLEVSARMLTRPWGGGRKSWLVKPSITAWLILAGVLLVLGLLSATVAWRVQALPRQHATALLSSLAAEHEAMWASVWGHLPARSEGRTEGTPSGNAAATLESNISYASWGWSLWPRPQVHLMDVRWSVPAELSSSGQLHLERLTLGLAWASLWTDVPRLHDVRAEGLAGSSRHTPWGLLSEWRLQEARLSSVGEGGVRRVSWTMESSLRPVRPAVPAPALDPTTPWLAGVWTGQARWHPMQPVAANRSGRQGGAGESEGEGEPAHWQQVDLRFRGQLGGRPVSSAHLSVARWMHNGAQERLAWDDLVLGLQLGEGAQAEQLELRSPALDLGPDSARGQGWSANGSTAVPLPLSWQMDSAPPRGRYTAVT